MSDRSPAVRPVEGAGSCVDPGARRVSFGEAFRFWLKLGFISFGGPAGQIAIMHREVVERRRWLSEERFLHALNYCMLLPGPEAQQLATYIGWLLHRTVGGLVAGMLFVLPSVFILLVISYIYCAHGNVPAVVAALAGFKPVVVAIVIEAVIRIGKRALRGRAHVAIAAAAFVAIYFLHVPFPLIVLLAGLAGLAGGRLLPSAFLRPQAGSRPSVPGPGPGAPPSPTVIDDHAPPPPHARPSGRRAIRTLCVCLVLWAVPFACVVIWRGGSSLHAEAYRFFSLAALITFGGAYAVLAYVTQVVTRGYGWLTPAQAIDGLALAETTPGPLIMVLQFLGFVAGWHRPEGMSPAAGATLAALITTYTTFLPCFGFIFIGAPYVEVLRGKEGLNAALGGITAAVVGVILNLALVFGATVMFPGGIAGGIDPFSLALAVMALLALWKLHVGVVWVVLGGGLIGLARAALAAA